ncbi:MAG: N-ethylmaleimide reductase [Polaribacter sp.]|jgi:N-ethylmaleimide reductase
MRNSISPLFEPVKIGRYTAKNRIFMAPMSRYRAIENGINPETTAEYYRQRASSGLIIAESTRINDWSGGMNCPGIYTKEQAVSWKKTTDAVHEEGGLIFLQLWHSGRAAHQSLLPEGRDVVAPSPLPSDEKVVTENGMVNPTTPREITIKEINEVRNDFANASRYALEAGFDGIEIHAAGGFLIDAFLQETTNFRTDQYGGSLENRYRFLGDIVDDAVEIWGADRVGIKMSPTSTYNNVGDGNVLDIFKYAISKLNTYGLAFLEINESMPFSEISDSNKAILDELRELWIGPYIANGNYTAETGTARIDEGKATAITYGRFYISNPDLPKRFKQNAPLNEIDADKFYGGDHTGYIDYPFLEEVN